MAPHPHTYHQPSRRCIDSCSLGADQQQQLRDTSSPVACTLPARRRMVHSSRTGTSSYSLVRCLSQSRHGGCNRPTDTIRGLRSVPRSSRMCSCKCTRGGFRRRSTHDRCSRPFLCTAPQLRSVPLSSRSYSCRSNSDVTPRMTRRDRSSPGWCILQGLHNGCLPSRSCNCTNSSASDQKHCRRDTHNLGLCK